MTRKSMPKKLRCLWCDYAGDDGRKFVIDGQSYKTICVKCAKDIGLSFLSREEEFDFLVSMLHINPIFRCREFKVLKNRCFYLGPFKEPFNTIYRDHVITLLRDIGFEIQRADDIYSVQPVMEDIWEGIGNAGTIIADVSGRNPNVMYEIGVAHTLGKPVVVLTQKIDDVPFDLRHYRCIVYKYTPPGIHDLQNALSQTMKVLWKEGASAFESDKGGS